MSSFDTGYDAYHEGRWADAVKQFLAADERETLQPDLLERLATAAYLVGRNDLSTESWTRAHQAYQDRADAISAARCAFWLGFQHLNSGAQASGFGWIARSGRLLADVHEECSEKGYIVLAGALQSIFGGEAEAAFDSFGEAAAIGHRVGDADLVALSLHGQGRALLRQGKVSDGIRLLDEAMVSITAGEVSALVSGTVGAVARDDQGRLAAATSTGGMANKTWGRVGDSPLIGAGTYASARCAVSCTGWGEFFIRNAAAYDVHARMTHGGATLSEAVGGVVFDTLEAQVPRSGGLVALDEHGNVELCYNTPAMYRGWIDHDGQPHVDIYGRE